MDRLPDWSLEYAADRHDCGGLGRVDIKGFYAHNAGGPCPARLEQILTGRKPPDRSCHALAAAVLCPQSGEQPRWRGDTRRRSEADPQNRDWFRGAPHPHIGGTVILEHEIRGMMSLTDPRFVWLVPDTAHLTLAGMDPLAIFRDFYPRIAEVHYKDVPVRFRKLGNPVPTGERDPETGGSLFQPMGTGGVDFADIHAFLLGEKYKGWVLLDYLGPRQGDGTGTFEQSIPHNKDSLVKVLHVTTLDPTMAGKSACEYGCMTAP